MPRKLLLAVVLVAAVLAAYRPVLDAGFIWNDDTYLTGNRTLDGLDGLRLVWTSPRANEQYYPMVFSSFWVEKRLWALHPFGYHLVNVLLHAGSALLLWRLLVRLRLPGAWLASAVFALHPLCVESVAWITERKNTLSLFLSLLAMLAYLASRGGSEREKEKNGDFLRKGMNGGRPARAAAERPPGPATAARRRSFSFAGILGFSLFVLALLAKTTAVVAPAVLLVLVWWKRGEIRGRDVRPLIPWFAAGIALAAHTAWLERTMVAAKGAEWSLGLAGRLQLAGRIVFFYSKKFLAPFDLAFIYERWAVDPRAPIQWLPAICALLALILAWRLRDRLGRGPLASLLFFGGVLFPAMGFFNVYPMRFSWVADHFAYQAVAVAAAVLACGGATLLTRASPGLRRAAAGGAALFLLAGAILTFRQARAYGSEEILWKDTLSKNPSCFLCETNYGIWLLEAGRDAEAADHLEASRRLKADEVPTLLNLAQADEKLGRLDASAASLRSALRVDPANAAALINLAALDARAGRVDEAIVSYREALRIGSAGDYLAHNGLGAALMTRGDAAGAIGHFREALRLRPEYGHARTNLERALASATVRDPAGKAVPASAP